MQKKKGEARKGKEEKMIEKSLLWVAASLHVQSESDRNTKHFI